MPSSSATCRIAFAGDVALLVLRQIERRQDRRLALIGRIARDDLVEPRAVLRRVANGAPVVRRACAPTCGTVGVVRHLRMKAHRSTSPITTSIEPMTAMTSAISPPTIICSQRLARQQRRRARLDAPRPVGAVRHDVEAVLAARPFDRHVGLAGRHGEALRVDQEVLNQRFHLRVDRSFGGGVMRGSSTAHDAGRRDPLERLPADLHALAHLGDAHQVARVDVAFGRASARRSRRSRSRRYGKYLAHVVVDAGRARDRARPGRTRARPPARSRRRPACARR